MGTEIRFSDQWIEKSLPIIRLTKSRNGKTGTATFIFVRPKFFSSNIICNYSIESIELIWEKKQIKTKDIHIYFLFIFIFVFVIFTNVIDCKK